MGNPQEDKGKRRFGSIKTTILLIVLSKVFGIFDFLKWIAGKIFMLFESTDIALQGYIMVFVFALAVIAITVAAIVIIYFKYDKRKTHEIELEYEYKKNKSENDTSTYKELAKSLPPDDRKQFVKDKICSLQNNKTQEDVINNQSNLDQVNWKLLISKFMEAVINQITNGKQ